MTPTQRTFFAKVVEARKLCPEVVSAIEMLTSEDLSNQEISSLIAALLKADEQEDTEFAIGGVIQS